MKTVTRTIGERTALSLTAGALALLRQSGRAVLVLLLLLMTSATAWAQTSASCRAYNTSTHAFETLTANSCTAVTSGTTTMSNGWYVVTGNLRHFPRKPIVVSPAVMIHIIDNTHPE